MAGHSFASSTSSDPLLGRSVYSSNAGRLRDEFVGLFDDHHVPAAAKQCPGRQGVGHVAHLGVAAGKHADRELGVVPDRTCSFSSPSTRRFRNDSSPNSTHTPVAGCLSGWAR